MQQDQSLRSRLARAHDVCDLLLPLIPLLSDSMEFAECGAVRVNSAGADTRHYVYSERSRPPGRSGGWGLREGETQQRTRGLVEVRREVEKTWWDCGVGGGAQPWNEMRVLISPGRVGSLWPSVWSGVGAPDRIAACWSAGNSNGCTEWVQKQCVLRVYSPLKELTSFLFTTFSQLKSSQNQQLRL